VIVTIIIQIFVIIVIKMKKKDGLNLLTTQLSKFEIIIVFSIRMMITKRNNKL
jgi:hypothetical protein